MSDLRAEINALLQQYLTKAISLDEFQAEFVPLVWNRNASDDPVADQLAADIELRLAEFSNRQAEEELQELLSQLSGPRVSLVFFDSPLRQTGSLSETVKGTLTAPVELIPV